MVKSPGGELSSAFETSKDNLRLLKYANIICLYARGQKGSCIGIFDIFVCKSILKQYIRLPQCMGIF